MTCFTNGNGLTAREFDLYGRQLVLGGIGIEGQKRLKNSRVAVVGAGGLGSPACLYLASCGIGFLRIIDGDVVAITNLQRQIIHDTTSLGRNKAESAVERCQKLNDMIHIEAVTEFLVQRNILDFLKDVDVVVDATDNARTRYLINDACCHLQVPLVFGSALRWQGQLSVFFPSTKGPCYRCLFSKPPETNDTTLCELQGVIGVAPGVIGTLQATEAIKLCLGKINECLLQRMLIFNALDPSQMWRNVALRSRNSNCICCKAMRPSFSELLLECSDAIYPTLSPENLISSQEFFKQILQLKLQPCPLQQKNIKSLRVIPEKTQTCLVLDVRPQLHFQSLYILGSRNIPLVTLLEYFNTPNEHHEKNSEKLFSQDLTHVQEIYCLCRKGKDASKAVVILQQYLKKICSRRLPTVRCVSGGIFGLKNNIPELREFPFL